MASQSKLERAAMICVALSSLVGLGFGIQHHITIYDPFVLVSSIIYVAIIIGTRWIHPNHRFTMMLQLFLIANMFLNGFGTFSFYRTSYYYDDVVHFFSPALLMYAGAAWQGIYRKPLWPATLFVLVIALGWEPIEILFDHWFQTHTYGQTDQPYDTLYDILMDLAGIASALGVYLVTRPQLERWLARASIHVHGQREKH